MPDSEEKKELLFGKVLMGTGGPIFKLPKQSIQKPVIAFLKELKKTTSQYINNEYISKNDFFEMKRKEYNEQKAPEKTIGDVPAYKRHLKETDDNQYNQMLEEYREYNKKVKDAKENRPFKNKSFNLILQKEGGSKNNNRKTKQNNRKTKQNNRKTKKTKKNKK
jgi:hypothetical protein